MRHLSICLLLFCCTALTAAINYSEPLPGPTWGVYIPADATDNAGITDATKKCHWFEKSNDTPAVVGGSWFTHLVYFNGTLITDNADAAIWDGANPVIHLQPKADNPAELEIVKAGGAVLTEADGYSIMRMVYIRPGSGIMPATALTGSPMHEPHRHKNEKQNDFTLAGNYWIAANECNQELWKDLVADNIPNTSGSASFDADIDLYLAADNITTNTDEFKGFGQPVLYATFADAVIFCTALTTSIGTTARLPNEVEWEYACRGSRASSFNTEQGYTLGGPEWELATHTSPPVPIDDADLDNYFTKSAPRVNGNTNTNGTPTVLSHYNVYIQGSWQNQIHKLEYDITGSATAITATQQFVGIAKVQANFDSRYKLWYQPVMYLSQLTHSDGVTAYFTVEESTIDDLTPTIKQVADKTGGGSQTNPTGEWASDDIHLAKIVKGLYVGVDASGAYSHDPDVIESFRLVTDGIMPNGVATPSGSIVYHKLAEFDNKGIYIQSPLPDEDSYFQDSDQQIADTVANLPLGTDNTTFRQDADELLNACIERHKTLSNYLYVDWRFSVYDYDIQLDYQGNLADKQGIYALRNRLGVANMHGNVAEWCIPGNSTDYRMRWDGVGSYDNSSSYALTQDYAVLRGGSWQSPAEKCRNAYRLPVKYDVRRPTIGFRFIIPE